MMLNLYHQTTQKNIMKTQKILFVFALVAILFSNSSFAGVLNFIYKDGTKVKAHQILVEDVTPFELKSLQAIAFNDNYHRKTLPVEVLLIDPIAVEGNLTISFSLKTKGNTSVQILDANGKDVYTEYMKNFSANYNREIQLPIDQVFYLQISQKGNICYKKIVMQ
jgi:hypothetical protein